jgi:hypothetical protein
MAMAKLVANGTLNVDWIDLNYFDRHYYAPIGGFYDNVNLWGYEDALEVVAYNPTDNAYDSLILLGRGFAFNGNRVSGTVEGLKEMWWTGTHWVE